MGRHNFAFLRLEITETPQPPSTDGFQSHYAHENEHEQEQGVSNKKKHARWRHRLLLSTSVSFLLLGDWGNERTCIYITGYKGTTRGLCIEATRGLEF